MDNEIYKKLYAIPTSFIIAALFITSISLSSESVIALQTGYTILSVGIFFLIALLLSKINNNNNSIYNLLIALFPLICLLVTTLFITILLYTYIDKIPKGVSDYYNPLLFLVTLFSSVQLYFIHKSVNDQFFMKYNMIQPKNNALLFFLATINGIIVATIYVIVKNYAADG
jgi:hypothetical protein